MNLIIQFITFNNWMNEGRQSKIEKVIKYWSIDDNKHKEITKKSEAEKYWLFSGFGFQHQVESWLLAFSFYYKIWLAFSF